MAAICLSACSPPPTPQHSIQIDVSTLSNSQLCILAFSTVSAATLANPGRPEGAPHNPVFFHRAASDVMQRDMEHAAIMWGDQVAVIDIIGADIAKDVQREGLLITMCCPSRSHRPEQLMNTLKMQQKAFEA